VSALQDKTNDTSIFVVAFVIASLALG